MRPREHQAVVGPRRVGHQDLVARLNQRGYGGRDAAHTSDGAVDVGDACLDPIDTIELGRDPLAQAQQTRGGRVLDLAFAREVDCSLDNMARGGEIRFADLEPDAARRDQRQVDDLSDARVGRLGGAGSDRGEGNRGRRLVS